MTLTGVREDGTTLTLGSAALTANNTGADGVQLPFTMNIADTADRLVLKSLTISVEVHGANMNSSNHGLSGDSKFTLPIYDAGVVQVSSDSSTFSPTKTVTTTVAPDGTWAAEIVAPSSGTRTIYARAVQAGVKVPATPVSITVTP